MNLKINLWTLLFLLAGGSAFYFYASYQDALKLMPACIKNINTGAIEKEEAHGRINAFGLYLDSINIVPKGMVMDGGIIQSGTFQIPLNDIPDANRRVRAFHIEKPCELQEILSKATDTEAVFAFLALEKYTDSLGMEKGMIDLLFAVQTEEAPTKFIDQKGYGFYDFTRPCPPTCDSVPSFITPFLETF